VIRATLAQQKKDRSRWAGKADNEESSGSGARYGLFATAAGGLSDLIAAIERSLLKSGRVTLHLGADVTSVERKSPGDPQSSGRPAWTVRLRDQQPEDFDAVIVTLPTYAAANLLKNAVSSELLASLNAIQYASSAIVVSGHQLSDFNHPMDAFGLVVPAIEQRKILAVSFSSRKFLGRAPEGKILLRTFVGGAMQPELLANDSDTIHGLVTAELRSIFGMKAEPIFSEVIKYNNAMPQYHVGHLDRVAAIESLAKQHAGLQLAGSAYHGVGIPDSIASGQAAADRIAAA
jgi:oxygen-dependent protoporphyrinogen oxidase